MSIKHQVSELRAIRKAVWDHIWADERKIAEIEKQISEVVASCPKTSGKKFASGGGGIPGYGGYYLECDICSQHHKLTKAELDTYPGKINYVAQGN